MALTNDKNKKISRQEKQAIRSGVRSRVKDLNALEEGPGKIFRKIKNYAIGAKSSRELIDNANKMKAYGEDRKNRFEEKTNSSPELKKGGTVGIKKPKMIMGGAKNKKMGMGGIKKK